MQCLFCNFSSDLLSEEEKIEEINRHIKTEHPQTLVPHRTIIKIRVALC